MMKLTLNVWRQKKDGAPGAFKTYQAPHVSPDMSFLEMLDVVNEELILKGEEPIAFDHDCREGICGMCSLMIDGIAHGPNKGVTTCQLHMRSFKDGDTITIEPWRAEPFPILKDLAVDRAAFDRIIQSGGFISASTGSAPDANAVQVPKDKAELSMDAAACIGCGACVAACPNASAMLFVGAKIAHLGYLPQGQAERAQRAMNMVTQMDNEGFGSCTNIGECAAVCPKEIKLDVIARMNRDLIAAALMGVEPRGLVAKPTK
jgi:succinate dehydrogenase / fumarate reductase, iron-sulfur subunit